MLIRSGMVGHQCINFHGLGVPGLTLRFLVWASYNSLTSKLSIYVTYTHVETRVAWYTVHESLGQGEWLCHSSFSRFGCGLRDLPPCDPVLTAPPRLPVTLPLVQLTQGPKESSCGQNN